MGPIPIRGILYPKRELGYSVRTMAKKLKRKPKKRGPKEERLVISGDPAAALQRLLQPRKPKR